MLFIATLLCNILYDNEQLRDGNTVKPCYTTLFVALCYHPHSVFDIFNRLKHV
jgi:hypothetical protein